MAPTLTTRHVRDIYSFLGSIRCAPLLQQWVNASVKFEELKVDHKSYREMRREKVLPKVLGKALSKANEMEPFSEAEDKALQRLIKETNLRKEAANIKASDCWTSLREAVTPHVAERPDILHELKCYCNGKINKAKAVHLKKAANNLKTQIADSKWERLARPGVVIDMSGNRVSKVEKKLLSFGLKFTTGLNTQTPLDVAKALNQFRYRHSTNLQVPSVEFVRASVIPYLETQRHTTLPERYVKAFRSLISKTDIKIVAADKGGAVGVMRATRYYQLGLDVLDDPSTFQQVQQDDVEACDVQEMAKAHNRRVQEVISRVGSEDEAKRLFKLLRSPPNPRHPTMTATAKFHKDPVKARPVISHRHTPMSRSCKWAGEALKPNIGRMSTSHIKDTRDFHQRLQRSKAKGRLVSFDVTSLYTNIPVAETIDVIRQHSKGSNPLYDLPIDPDVFCDLLEVLTAFNQFSFMGQYYRQCSGVPMGSSLSPGFSNIYMEWFETALIDDIIPKDKQPQYWLRYIDDVICCFEDLSVLYEFLSALNSIRDSISFTV